MSAPSCHSDSFRLVSLVGELPQPFGEDGYTVGIDRGLLSGLVLFMISRQSLDWFRLVILVDLKRW